jgi:hypothetical protein
MAMSSLANIYIPGFSVKFFFRPRVELSDTFLKWDYPRTIPARLGLIWFSSFRGENLKTFVDFDRLCKLEKREDENLKKSSPRKLLSQYQPNFAEMILGWPPSKIVSVDGEDLNVIFYQNMPNLHNRYISVERKISQKNLEYMLNYSLPCSCS